MNKAREIATAIARQLQDNGYMGLFVGGCVRDQFLGVEPKDYDVTTNAPPEKVLEIFSGDGAQVVGNVFGVALVNREGVQVEIATFRSDGQYSDGRHPDSVTLLTDCDPFEAMRMDAARRDLTVNAMFLDPVSGELYDFFEGRADIESRTMRAVGSAVERLQEHPIRMLRVARLKCKLGFTVEPGLLEAMKAQAGNLFPVSSWEAIAKELEGILLSKAPVTGLELLMESGLMAEILPEMLEMVGENAVQDPIWHPEGSAWVHTLMVLAEAAKEEEKSFEFMLGVFLHDIAKPRTMSKREEVLDGVTVIRVSNRGHAEVGAEMAKAICKRLKLSSDTTHRVSEIVRMHMQMHDFNDPNIRRSRLVKLMQRPDIMDLIRMQHADVMGTGRTLAERQESSHRGFYLNLLEELAGSLEPSQRLNAEALVTGAHVKEMGFKPGPIFRVIKEAALAAQHDGEFTDSAGAAAWLTENAARFRAMTAQEIAAHQSGEDMAVAVRVGSKHCC